VIFHSPNEVTSVTGGELVSSEKVDIIRLKFEGANGEYGKREVSINFEK
jgi:hypothetical protein